MSNISMKNLLETGVHFGHQKKKWNPKMAPFIFGVRNNIHIIDLQKTVKYLKIAYEYVRDEVSNGKNILFVGTKRQAQMPILEEAKRCGMYYVNNRWLGGLLTNFDTVSQSIKKLKSIEELKNSPTFSQYTKKEIARLNKVYEKLNKNLAGIKDMPGIPDMLFIIDIEQEKTAVKEAKKLGIPVVAVVDTNCDPSDIDVIIPGNDDAIRAVKLFASTISSAVIEGKELSSKGTMDDLEKENTENLGNIGNSENSENSEDLENSEKLSDVEAISEQSEDTNDDEKVDNEQN